MSASSNLPCEASRNAYHWCAVAYRGSSSIARRNSLLRALPVPVVDEQAPRQRRVRLRQRIVQLDRLARVELCALEAFVRPARCDSRCAARRSRRVRCRRARTTDPPRSPARSTLMPSPTPSCVRLFQAKRPSQIQSVRFARYRCGGRLSGVETSANDVERSLATIVRAISSWIANTSSSVRS